MTRFDDSIIENYGLENRQNDLLNKDNDLLMEQILNNINITPLGNVLKRIASMPEIRQNKVLEMRKRLSSNQYELDDRLDVAMERVLEDLKT